jgi:hypothetical protein
MDQIFTSQFWHDQWVVITSAPWLVIPLLLVAGLVGWKWKGGNDEGEIRGLRAELDTAAQRLEFAREQYEAVVKQLKELRDKVAQQDSVIAEFKRTAIAPARVDQLVTSNTEIKSALTNLSTSTSSLGQALRVLRNTFTATLPSESQ